MRSGTYAQDESSCDEGSEVCGDSCCPIGAGCLDPESGACCFSVICEGVCCGECDLCAEGVCQPDPALNGEPGACLGGQEGLTVCCDGACIEGTTCESTGDDDDVGDDDDSAGDDDDGGTENIESLPNTGGVGAASGSGWTSAATAGAAILGASILIRDRSTKTHNGEGTR